MSSFFDPQTPDWNKYLSQSQGLYNTALAGYHPSAQEQDQVSQMANQMGNQDYLTGLSGSSMEQQNLAKGIGLAQDQDQQQYLSDMYHLASPIGQSEFQSQQRSASMPWQLAGQIGGGVIGGLTGGPMGAMAGSQIGGSALGGQPSGMGATPSMGGMSAGSSLGAGMGDLANLGASYLGTQYGSQAPAPITNASPSYVASNAPSGSNLSGFLGSMGSGTAQQSGGLYNPNYMVGAVSNQQNGDNTNNNSGYLQAYAPYLMSMMGHGSMG